MPSQSWNGTVDLLRFIGSGGIVWFHTGAPGARFALTALPMFVALAVYFNLRGGSAVPGRKLVVRRARRLLVPWVAWSAIYGILKIAEAMAAGKPVSSEFEMYMLFTGPRIHLWFLPFVFVAVLAGRAVLDRLPVGPVGFAILLIGMIIGSAAALLACEAASPGPPLVQWLTSLPAVLLGLAMVRAEGDGNRIRLLLSASVSVFTPLIWFGVHAGTISGLLASLLVCGMLAVAIPTSPFLLFLSSLSFGIYLVHPLVASVLERVSDIPDGTLEMTLMVFALSVLASDMMLRIPGLRLVV